MKQRHSIALASLLLLFLTYQPLEAGDPNLARVTIRERCLPCHQVPGFVGGMQNPDIKAPDFQTLANNPKIYTRQRLEAFLMQPHFPMPNFKLSENDIDNLITFIESLRDTRIEGRQP